MGISMTTKDFILAVVIIIGGAVLAGIVGLWLLEKFV